MKTKKWIALLVLILLALALSGCAPGDGSHSETRLAGFFSGVWHGWIAPVTLIWSLFNHNISLYEAHNTGFWYNLGFYMAIISGFGGLTLSRRKARKKRGEE
jgi:hypothetical protein